MIDIYTDGACSGNPGPGGSAVVIVRDNQLITSRGQYLANATNNIAEMTAVVHGLCDLLSRKESGTIYSDSLYVVNGITLWLEKWKSNAWIGSNGKIIKNSKMWMLIDDLLDKLSELGINVSIKHVEGHSGNKWNELADKLAKHHIKINKNGANKK